MYLFRYLLCFCGLLPALLPARAQDASVVVPPAYNTALNNYIRSWVAVKPDTAQMAFTTATSVQVAVMTTQYFDGLGRPIQTVVKQGSLATGGTATDLVSAVLYDEWGRVQRNYLPFGASSYGGNTSVNDGGIKLNPFQQQQQFYSDANGKSPVYGQGQTYYYSKNEIEPSPLNRVERSYAAGNSWVHEGRGVQVKYLVNTVGDSVKSWTVTNTGAISSFGTYSTSGNYAAGELFKNITEDEQGKQTIEFKDKEGKVVLRKVQLTAGKDSGQGNGHVGWLCTYYIYDLYNLLRAVIQPQGVILLQANSWNVNALSGNILAEQFFRYKYDGKRRRIMQKAPGVDSVFTVYDARDRVVLQQDGVTRNTIGWLYTQYDSLNRVIATGTWANFENLDSHYVRAYNSISYPVVSGGAFSELSATFYDNYDWLANYSTPLSATRTTAFDSYLLTPSDNDFPYPQAVSQSASLKGLATGSRIRIWRPGVDSFLYAINYYDNKGRAIQQERTNITGGVDVSVNQFSFNGLPLFTINKTAKVGKNAQTTIVLNRLTYDTLCRPVKREMKLSNSLVNSGSMPSGWTTILQLQYDALGKVKKKLLGNNVIDSVVYDYNIRGWLLGVNRDFVKDTTSTANYFGYDLGYDQAAFVVNGLARPYAAAQYNGNVAGTNWRSIGDGQVRRFDFAYDAVNRLTAAPFTQLTNTNFDRSAGLDFSMSGLGYDANGNMLSLNRRGWKGGGSAIIDSLMYNYQPYSNKLWNIIDHANDTATRLGDFRTSSFYLSWMPGGAKTATTRDYYWDRNGNLYRDFNKDIYYTNYNYMNLPEMSTFYNVGDVVFTYDCNKTKLRKIIQRTAGNNDTTLYINNLEYLNDTLQTIVFEEGRIRYNKDKNAFFYDYFLRDHLNSVRMVLTEEKDTARYPAVTFENSDTAGYNKYYLRGTDQQVARPGAFYDTTTNKHTVQLLRKSVQSLGVGKLLKVMAGDRLHVKVDYYTPDVTPDNSHANGLTTVLASLVSLIDGGGAAALLKGSGAALSGSLQSSLPFLSQLANQDSSTASADPKAYLNILFFDEQFRFVADNSESIQTTVKGVGQTLSRIGGSAKRAVKNGYVYMYVCNESDNLVYFDNFQVSHEHGPIVSETHYYPYGLKMAGICSNAIGFGAPKNKLQFSGKEHDSGEFGDAAGLETLDFGNRSYDAQTGRWTTMDPLADLMRRFSPFAYAFDNPLRYVDPDGLAPTSIYFDEKGRKIGRDENGDDGKVRIVTNEKEIAAIKANEKAGTYTASDQVVSGVATTKVVIGEAINVLERQINNGGKKEEMSQVTSDGTITRAPTGSGEVKGADQYGDGGYTESGSLPVPKGDDNTQIHSHMTAFAGDVQSQDIKTGNAEVPGPVDPERRQSFRVNVIVGNLGWPTFNKEAGTGHVTMSKPDQGAVFYSKDGDRITELTTNALKRIIK